MQNGQNYSPGQIQSNACLINGILLTCRPIVSSESSSWGSSVLQWEYRAVERETLLLTQQTLFTFRSFRDRFADPRLKVITDHVLPILAPREGCWIFHVS